MNTTVADLMRSNLLAVFNEGDPERRSAAIAVTYAPDIVWHEPDRLIRGREALAERATELRAQSPQDWVFRPAGPVFVNDDLGQLAFHLGPDGQPPVVSGMDIGHCKDGVIVELYTLVSGASDQS